MIHLFNLPIFFYIIACENDKLFGDTGGEGLETSLSDADAKITEPDSNNQLSILAGGGDFNGDGHAETALARMADSDYQINMFWGTLSGENSVESSDTSFYADSSEHVYNLQFVGDTNNDGYDEFVVGTDFGSFNSTGAVYLFQGNSLGNLDTDDMITLIGSTDNQLGLFIGAGDLNDDHYSDLILGGVTHSASLSPEVFVYQGPFDRDLEPDDAVVTITANPNGDGSVDVAGIKDFDGDGYDDILLGNDWDDYSDTYSGSAFVMLGPVSGSYDLEDDSDATYYSDKGNVGLGYKVGSAGDMDDDGYADFLVSTSGVGLDEGVLFLVAGPSLSSSNDIVESYKASFFYDGGKDGIGNASLAGDVNGDGNDDLLISLKYGGAFLVYGPVSGTFDILNSAQYYIPEDGVETGELGLGVSYAGDNNLDGFADLLFLNNNDEAINTAYLFYGK